MQEVPTHKPTAIITILRANNYEVLTVLKALLRALMHCCLNFQQCYEVVLALLFGWEN